MYLKGIELYMSSDIRSTMVHLLLEIDIVQRFIFGNMMLGQEIIKVFSNFKLGTKQSDWLS